VFAYRDPYVFHDGDTWRMIMGAGLADGTPTAYDHSSPDLETWSFDGELARRSPQDQEPLWMGTVWECPQLFTLGDEHVLTVSVWQPFVPFYEAYSIGRYADGRFEARVWGRLSYGPSHYAGFTYVDEHGRRGLIYWLRGMADLDGGWASANSLPHVLGLDRHGDRVVALPHPSLEAARGRVQRLDDVPGGADGTDGADGARRGTTSSTCDVVWTLDDTARAGLVVENAHVPGLLVDLDVRDGVLTATVTGAWQMPVEDGEVRIVLDGPVVELFAATGVMAFPVPATESEVTIAVRRWTADVFALI
jgi:beta-fructofuranosidase